MQNKKIFILLPDGVGLRNFAYTNFHDLGIEEGFEIIFWNATQFDLEDLNFNEIKIKNPRVHPLTDLLKRALIQIELNINKRKSKDSIYDSYRFPFSTKTLSQILKKIIVSWFVLTNNSLKGVERIKNKINSYERKTNLYFDSLETLKREKPALVFCTNQRISTAVSQILAAQDLGIPTVSFIFSWDNLPKGTKIIDTDYYFVWSEHMKNELCYYYPKTDKSKVIVTGTPQFEPHFDETLIVAKELFYKKYTLDLNKKYICFSGDDVTTSPNDSEYLLDVAKAVRKLNAKGNNLGIIFRRCPVDFSTRYDNVLNEYSDVITSISPIWKRLGEAWNSILPMKDDVFLLMNTIYYSEFVINLGSSMVFDFVAFNKPCGFINYDVLNKNVTNWNVKKIYNFIHFRSMPNQNAVFWLDNPNKIDVEIEKMLNKSNELTIQNAKLWFEKINQSPAELASKRIWDAIDDIVK